MNRQIRQLAVGLMACYIVLFVALNYWQVGRKEELDARFDNTREVLKEFNKPRGPIVTADGVVAARSIRTAPDATDSRPATVRTRNAFGFHGKSASRVSRKTSFQASRGAGVSGS